jgi:4-amino-4-deoxy-L-arabinose transferase-like glycosyltransferase
MKQGAFLKVNRFLSDNQRILVILFLILAVLIRLVYSFTLTDPFFSDYGKYVKVAKYFMGEAPELRSYCRVMPGYPLFLAGIFSVFGESFLAVRVAQALIGGGISFLIYAIANKVMNKRVAFVAVIISVFYPTLVFWSGALISEYLFTFSILCLILFLLKFIDNFTYKMAMGTGMLLGITLLIRPMLVFWPIFIVLWVFLCRKYDFKEILNKCFVMCIFTIITLSPWIIRNYMVLGHFVPFTTDGGYALYVSNHPTGDGTSNLLNDEVIKFEDRVDEMDLDPVESNNYYFNEFLNNIKNAPFLYLKLIPKKFIRLWSIYPHTSIKHAIISILSYGILLPFAIYGIWYSNFHLRNTYGILMTLLFVYVTLFFCFLFYGLTRFRFPVEPYIIIFSAISFERFIFHENVFTKFINLRLKLLIDSWNTLKKRNI